MKMKSIKLRFSLIFIGLMMAVIILVLIVNKVFLPEFYTKAKTAQLQTAYEQLFAMADTASFDAEEFTEKLNHLSMTANISIVVVDYASDTLYSSGSSDKDLEYRLLAYIFGRENEINADSTIVASPNDSYIIRRVSNIDKSRDDFLEAYGQLDNGFSFLMRTPMESIRESAKYANRFFTLAGIIGAVLGGIVIWIVTGMLTKPIAELNEISKRMVDLDFEVKYTGNGRDEIGILGRNMNTLSGSLEKSISELKNANFELKKDIEKKDEIDKMRQEFISNVSHELKTPISLIQGYAEGIREGVTQDDESRNEYLDVIIDEANRMNDLVKKLLTLNQLENGAKVVNFERFDISELIAGFLQNSKILAQGSDIELINNVNEPIYVWGDSYLAEEVFGNYYSNAVRYCKEIDDNGNKVKKIEISAEKIDGKVRINIYNTGDKIPDDAYSRVWEKFYRIDKARSREMGGNGVGLSIVKAIQDLLEEGYGVTNCENGVCFWFELGI